MTNAIDKLKIKSASALISHQRAHYYHELPIDAEERLAKLFRQLDVDGDGRIDIKDLHAALKQKGLKTSHENVKVISSIIYINFKHV